MNNKLAILIFGIGGILIVGLIAGCTNANGWHGSGPSMMGGWGSSTRAPSSSPLSMDQALSMMDEYIQSFGNSNLIPGEIMEFDNHFYATVFDQGIEKFAFEVLIDRFGGWIQPEPGPNMMWNTQYGHHSHMGWGFVNRGVSSDSMTIASDRAREIAQDYLNRVMPGTIASDELDAFSGYYTLHILKDEQVIGMMSIHGSSGQVWYHNWHGEFLGMRSLIGHEDGAEHSE